MNGDTQTYGPRMSHILINESKNGYNEMEKQNGEMSMHGHMNMDKGDNMMGKEHNMMGKGHNMMGKGHNMMGKGHGMMHMDHMENMQMQATFSLTTYSDFLIEGIKISSVQGIVLAMLFTVVITILFDSLKFTMYIWELRRGRSGNTPVQTKKQNWILFVTAVSHMSSVCLAYIMMLCVMTMNVWLMVSVVLGSGIGHFFIRALLSWRLQRQAEQCKKSQVERTPEQTAEELMPLNQSADCPCSEKRKKNEDSKKVLTARRSLLIEDSSFV